MANIITLTQDLNGLISMNDLNANISALNNSKVEKGTTMLTVGVNGQYTTIQAGINALPALGGMLQLIDSEYDLTVGLTFPKANVEIVGNAEGTVIAVDGSVVSTLISVDPTATAQTVGRITIRNIALFQTNATKQGVAIDNSNMSLNIYDNVSITGFGTALKMNDTQNFTFFNRFRDLKIFLCNNGIDITSTNSVNDNMFDNVRISLNVGGAGFGLKLTNGLDNAFYDMSIDLGATIGPGNTGIILNDGSTGTLVRHNNFYNLYVENAGTLGTISNARDNAFYGGAFIWGAQTSSGLTDTGTGTNFYGTRVDTASNVITTVNKFGSPFSSIDNSSSGNGTNVIQNNANFAHDTNPLLEVKFLNAGDSSTLLKLTNPGDGITQDIQGTIVYESVTKTQLVANTDNYVIGTGVFFRLSTDASRNITGLAGGISGGVSAPAIDGRLIYVRNIGAQNIVLKNLTTSTSANQFSFSTGADITLAPLASITLMYDGTSAKWFDLN